MHRLILIIFFIGSWLSHGVLGNALDHRYQKAFRVQALSLEDGLSQSVVNDIIQDSEGFIWVATEDGLNRFDGYDFKIFEHDHDDQNSLHDNYIYALTEDPGVGIWIGTQNGLSLYNPVNQKFVNYQSKNKDLKTSIASLVALNLRVYIGSDNGLFYLDKKTEEMRLFTSATNKMIDDEITSLEVSGGVLWIATESCIYSLVEQSQVLTSWCQGELGVWLKKKAIKVIKVRESELWIATSNGLGSFNLKTNQLRTFSADREGGNGLSSSFVQDIEFDDLGNLWIATLEGVNVLRNSEPTIEHFQHRSHDRDGLTSNDIMSIFIDKTGLIWLGTYATGLNILDPAQTGFKHILTKSDVVKFESNNTIHGIHKDRDENLWLASYGGGVFKLDLMTGELTRPFHQQVLSRNENYLYSYSLYVDRNEHLWVGTIDGLYIVDLETYRVFKTDFVKSGRSVRFNDYITQIYEDHHGDIWLAAKSGLFKVEAVETFGDRLTMSLTDMQNEIPHSFRDRSGRVAAILETRDGNLWAGGPAGLLRYLPSQERWKHFEYHPENSQSLSYDDVQVLFEDSRGILWVGTANGLNKVHRSDNDEVYFERITKANGLPNNTIYGILEDNYKQLWLSTNLGLVRYSGQAESVQSYRRNDGLSSDEFNTGAYFIDNGGDLYFGGINGVTVVDSRVNRERSGKRRLLVTEATVGQRQLDVFKLNHTQNPIIEKKQDESTIRISVSDLYFEKLNAQSYRYRLLGLDQDWVYLDKERTVLLAGLREGRYLLDIQSKVGNELWSSNNLRIEILVFSGFLQSQNALYLISLGGIAVFLLSLYLLRRYYLQRMGKMDNLIKIEAIRLKDAKEQNDELKKELETKVFNIDSLTEQLGRNNKQLESYQFRDSVSGFYRYDKMLNLLSEPRYFEENGLEDSLNFSVNSFVLIVMSDIDDIGYRYGKICRAEVVSYVANELRKSCPSQVNICVTENDSFLVLGNAKNALDLTSNLVNLRNKLIRSQIPIANDLTVTTRIGLSYIEFVNDTVERADILANLTMALRDVHALTNPGSLSGVMRLDVKLDLNDFHEPRSRQEVEQLVKKKQLQPNFL